MNNINYQKELDKLLALLVSNRQEGDTAPSLLLHSCCAPCSSYVLEYLSVFFRITVYYYNPNITAGTEYRHRAGEQKRLINELNTRYLEAAADKQRRYNIDFIEGEYEPQKFAEICKGLENEPEGGKRCFECYRLRLKSAVEYAETYGYDYVTTTLSISPLKNAVKLNEIGMECTEGKRTLYLCSDFKKKDGYKRSIELSREYDLYRQDYCGCSYSKTTGHTNNTGSYS